MEFQIINDSLERNIFVFGGLFVLLALIAFMIFSKMTPKMTVGIFCAGLALFIASLVGVLVVDQQGRDKSDVSFSKQLMDEYNAASSRPFQSIDSDFSKYHEANTIFTQDGRETPVSIQLVSGNDKKVTMVFTVMNDKSLYPKPSK